MNSSEKNLKKENNIHYIKDVDKKENEKKDEYKITSKIGVNKFSEKEKEEIVKGLLKEIGVILILIYNKNIKTTLQVENEKDKKEKEDIEKRLEKFKKQISYCSKILGTYSNNYIIESLLINIMKHIKTYKAKILEIQKVKDLITMTTYIKKSTRIPSPNKKIIKKNRKNIRSNSTLNHSSNNLKIALTTLFCQIRDIKRSLNNSVSDIEDIFKIPLSKINNFDVKDIQKSLFYSIIQNDPLIKECIEKFKFHSDYHVTIKEIEFGTENILGKIIKKRFIFNDEKSSNIELEIKDQIVNIKTVLNNDNIPNENKIDDTDEYYEDDEVNQFKENIENFSQESNNSKLKCFVSKKWLNNLINGLKDCKTIK